MTWIFRLKGFTEYLAQWIKINSRAHQTEILKHWRQQEFLQISRKETKQSKTKYIDHIKKKGAGESNIFRLIKYKNQTSKVILEAKI